MEELTASVYYRDANGTETPLAGMAMSGALVPSASHLRSGTVTANISSLDNLAQVRVTFDSPMPDNNYMVNIEVAGWGGAGNLGTNISITNKSTNGFLIRQYVAASVSTPSMTYRWTAFRLNTTEQIALDEGQIEQNKTDIATINSLIPSNATTTNNLATVGLLQGYSTNPYTDCNVILKVGTYSITPLVSNRPSDCDYGVMMVFGNTPNVASASSQWIYQYFYETAASGGVPGRVYRRMCINPNTLTPSASQWSVWELVNGIENGTITRNTSISESMNEAFLQKTGRVAQLHANINGCVITGNQLTTIATVSAGFLPACSSWMLIEVDFVAQGVRCFMNASGEIQVLFPQSGTYNIRIDKTYITAS